MTVTIDPVSVVLAVLMIVGALDALLRDPAIGIGLWLGTMIPLCLWEIRRQMERE